MGWQSPKANSLKPEGVKRGGVLWRGSQPAPTSEEVWKSAVSSPSGGSAVISASGVRGKSTAA